MADVGNYFIDYGRWQYWYSQNISNVDTTNWLGMRLIVQMNEFVFRELFECFEMMSSINCGPITWKKTLKKLLFCIDNYYYLWVEADNHLCGRMSAIYEFFSESDQLRLANGYSLFIESETAIDSLFFLFFILIKDFHNIQINSLFNDVPWNWIVKNEIIINLW